MVCFFCKWFYSTSPCALCPSDPCPPHALCNTFQAMNLVKEQMLHGIEKLQEVKCNYHLWLFANKMSIAHQNILLDKFVGPLYRHPQKQGELCSMKCVRWMHLPKEWCNFHCGCILPHMSVVHIEYCNSTYKFGCTSKEEFDQHIHKEAIRQLEQVIDCIDGCEYMVTLVRCPKSHFNFQVSLGELFDQVYYKIFPMLDAHLPWTLPLKDFLEHMEEAEKGTNNRYKYRQGKLTVNMQRFKKY